jgi:hypothetical protein
MKMSKYFTTYVKIFVAIALIFRRHGILAFKSIKNEDVGKFRPSGRINPTPSYWYGDS